MPGLKEKSKEEKESHHLPQCEGVGRFRTIIDLARGRGSKTGKGGQEKTFSDAEERVNPCKCARSK